MNPLVELQKYGQSFWYDNIRRRLLVDRHIANLISEDGLRGMTSNPSIFEKAIGSDDEYDQQIIELSEDGADVKQLYEALVVDDIRRACDLFREVFESSERNDGYVSLEVSPHLARDYGGTLVEAKRLFYLVDRPNLMIKVPATKEGVPAVQQLIGQSVNINITLMFNRSHYESVSRAYLEGISQLIENGGEPSQVRSVASFFVSRVDTAVDALLAEMGQPETKDLLGEVAIANAKVVYQRYKEIFEGERFEKMRLLGAEPQRLLWASTSTKNPAYPDTLYVDELIGRNTVNTMPPHTIRAFRDHGTVRNALEENVDQASNVLERLTQLEIDLDEVTEDLQKKGVKAFADSYDKLLETLEEKQRKVSSSKVT